MNYPLSTLIDKTAADIDEYVTKLAAERSLNDDVLEYVINKVLNGVKDRKITALAKGYISALNAAEDAQRKIKEIRAEIEKMKKGEKPDE